MHMKVIIFMIKVKIYIEENRDTRYGIELLISLLLILGPADQHKSIKGKS